MNGKIKLYVMASVVALCAVLGPASGSANAQYYNGRPTFVDRLFGNGYNNNNYGNYGNFGNYGFNRGFGGMGYHCGGNGNGWGGGWGNGWHHHHHRHFW